MCVSPTRSSHPPQQRVGVGLSGGVDSAVAAALLKKAGHDVVGIYMKSWNDASPALGAHPLAADRYRFDCPWYDDYLDAKRVALKLAIPFHVWDFRDAYKQKVFDHFIDELAKGRTPNPDIYCNSLVKFADFAERARMTLGVDCIATGHYARRLEVADGTVRLQIPMDQRKDQTYFLYRLSQEQLQFVQFPLADFTKDEVRELAVKFDLPTKYKKDSQGICFVGDVDVRQFIGHWLAPKNGSIVDSAGRPLGEHRGAHFYTIGEKLAVDGRRVGRFYPEFKEARPHFYVAAKDVRTNRVTVVPGADHAALYKKQVHLEDVVWGSTPPIWARIRHGGPLVPVENLTKKDGGLIVSFVEPQRALAPGQHVVFYDATLCLCGGGVIIA